jgi:CHAT domain-containing protein/tetratricopeptide (TPR) repeat protein
VTAPSPRPGWGWLPTLMLVLSGVAGWWLSGPFGALATGGWAGVGLLSLLGYLIGRNDVGHVGVVFGIGMLFGGVEWPAVLVFWMLPIVVGFLVRMAVKRGTQTSDPLGPPSIAVHAWLYFGLIVGLAPPVAAVATSVRGSSVTAVGLLAGGAVIFVSFVLDAWLIFRLTRYVALGIWRAKALSGAAAALLAFGPFGRWLVHGLTSTPAVYRAAPWLLPLAAVVLTFVTPRVRPQPEPLKLVAVLGAQLFGNVRAVIVDSGMFLFYATGVAYPNGRLFAGCLGVIATQVALSLWFMRGAASPLWSLRRVDAEAFVVGARTKPGVLGGWLYDAVLAKPRHPDLTLLHTLAAEATFAVMREGGAMRSRFLPVNTTARQLIKPATEWIALLDWLLDMADRQVEAAVPENGRRYFQDSRDLVLAHRLVCVANVERQKGQWAQATEHYRSAASLLDRHDRPNLAASAGLSAAELDAGELARFADALETATAVAEDEQLNPVIRQRADLVAGTALRVMNQEADAKLKVGNALRMRPDRRAYRALVREDRHIGLCLGVRAERAYNRRLAAAASDASGSITAAGFELGDASPVDHRLPRVRGPLRRLRLDAKYVWQIEALLKTPLPGWVLLMRPELLSDDALRVVERMIGSAQKRGESDRAAGLVVVQRLLEDAREHGVEAAIAAIPPRGPLPFQSLLVSPEERPLDPDDPDDMPQIARQLQQTEVAMPSREVVKQVLESSDKLPPDVRAAWERFGSRLIDFQHSPDERTLDEVIEVGRRLADDLRVVELIPDLSASVTADLGTMLVNRFVRSGRAEDLTEALRRVRAALEAAPRQHLDYHVLPALLSVLAAILRTRAWAGADQAELDEAIVQLERMAVLPGGNAAIAHYNLGLAHQDRYMRTGDLSDLERAVREHESGLEKVQPGSTTIPLLHQGQAISLQLRFARTGNLAELNAAVESFRKAVDLTPLHSPTRATLLIGLGDALGRRGAVLGSLGDLQAGGKLLTDAFELLPEGFLAQIAMFHLAQVMRAIYLATQDTAWLDRAVLDFQLASGELSTGSLMYPEVYGALADTLRMRYDVTGNPADADQATETYRKAVSTTAADHAPGVLSAARLWADWAVARSAWPEAVEAGEHALSAAHRLLRTQLHRAHKEDWLLHLQGLPTEIAIARAHTGAARGAALAVEEGSATLLSEALQRQRVEFDRLEASGHAALAARYRTGAAKLALLTRKPGLGDPLPMRPEADPDQRERAIRAAAQSLDSIIDEIRAVPGYEGFLQRPTFASIKAAARHHPLIYLAAGRREGLALVVRGGKVTPVLLPKLTAGSVRERGDRLRVAQHTDDLPLAVDEITHWLWDTAAEPVLPHVQGAGRITVIPVGHLSALPLHAARPATSGDRSLQDRMVVTYSPNVRALLESARQAGRVTPDRLLAVAEPAPVDGPPLPSANAEAAVAAATFTPSRTLLAGPDANRAAVLAALGAARVVHFACHGYAVTDQPWLSGVLVAGNEPLTVADLAAQGLDARLVVLSACQTAVPGTTLPEEVIGLPTAMLQAGTAAVVASLWPVLDSRSLLLMVSFYEHWRHHGLSPADALHAAQHWMRATSDGEKFEKFDALLGGTGWLPTETARACWNALVLTEPAGLFYADPVGWGAFCYVGS